MKYGLGADQWPSHDLPVRDSAIDVMLLCSRRERAGRRIIIALPMALACLPWPELMET